MTVKVTISVEVPDVEDGNQMSVEPNKASRHEAGPESHRPGDKCSAILKKSFFRKFGEEVGSRTVRALFLMAIVVILGLVIYIKG